MNHYNYLDEYFQQFATNCGVTYEVDGLIGAHGDKFRSRIDFFKEHGFNEWQGTAIGLLSYINPWARECRDTDNGFIAFEDWFVKNKEFFRDKFPKINKYEVYWSSSDGLFGEEYFETFKDAEECSWDYIREGCKTNVSKEIDGMFITCEDVY